jgi:hypothetical protein|tara:strand:- start:73 stop:342 length:270 start_codon:yes stop_codon:yes gene_type:complete
MVDYADYPFECSCGERFTELIYAIHCKKCRVYTEEEMCIEVWDVLLGIKVWESPMLRHIAANEERERLQAQKEDSAFTLGSRLSDLMFV